MSKRIALLVEDLYQDQEVWYPYFRLIEEGYTVDFIGMKKTTYTGKYGYPLEVHKAITEVTPLEYDAVIIPGGFAPDLMRKTRDMINFVKQMHDVDKLVASICHGAWIPVSADIVKGKTATCYYAIADDIRNAGANYVDEEVVVDGSLITSRTPNDLPAFCKAIISYLHE